ncbi:MAG: 4-(cytidine 5'-diphospho)-2-C-methyl-D-erythritol kinase [Clostridia bacterium]|nr:4-(cytidine 5'-diphospho)-2-C-methyl-D-erythritol kinase [Clostridia bacterium]
MLSDDIVITGNRVIARSYAKINLTLDVIGKRPNGYHDVEMIMQTVSLFDLIIVDKTYSGITISTNLKYLPTNEKNIAYKAAQIFFKKTGIQGGVRIIIHKNIPVAAGLAGGSGNGAAVLCAMNALFNAELSEHELCSIAAELGADVPYCIMGGTRLAEGIGEILTPLPSMPKTTTLIVKPPINVSTAAIYEQIDNASIEKRPDTKRIIKALETGNVTEIAQNMCNVMEAVTEKMHPVVGGIKKKLLINGAVGAVMSGSGPSVFGFFDDDKKAKLSHDSFAHQYKDVFLVKTLN